MESVLEILGSSGIIIIGYILIIVAFIGSVLPALPGVPIAAISVLLLHFTGMHKYSWWMLTIVIVLSILISLVDYVVPVWGTKKYGGSKAGIRGSTIGLIIGAIISFFTGGIGILALFAGPFVGAYIGEKYYAHQSNEIALRSAWGSLVGFLAGTVAKIIVVIFITVVFTYGVFSSF